MNRSPNKGNQRNRNSKSGQNVQKEEQENINSGQSYHAYHDEGFYGFQDYHEPQSAPRRLHKPSGFRGGRNSEARMNAEGFQGPSHGRNFSEKQANNFRSNSRNRSDFGSTQSLPVSDWEPPPRNQNFNNRGRNRRASQNAVRDTHSQYGDDDDKSSIHSNQSYNRYGRRGFQYKPSCPKIAVYWDIENCQIPNGKSALFLVKQIRDQFYEGHTEDEFVVVCDTSKMKKETIEELTNAVVDILNVSSTCKNAADESLRRRLREFGTRNKPPATIVIITGDVNFTPDIHDLRYKKMFHVILIHNQQANMALQISANESLVFENFVKELPEVLPTNGTPMKLMIRNIGKPASKAEINKRLRILFDTYKGKIVFINPLEGIALLQFASSTDAERAKTRLQKEDVCGGKIRIFEYKQKKVSSTADSKENAASSDSSSSNTSRNKVAKAPNVETPKATPVSRPAYVNVETKNFSDEAKLIECLVQFKLTLEELKFQKGMDIINIYIIKCASQNVAKKVSKAIQKASLPGIEGIEITEEVARQAVPTAENDNKRLIAQLEKRKNCSILKHNTKWEELKEQESLLEIQVKNMAALNIPPGNYTGKLSAISSQMNFLLLSSTSFKECVGKILDDLRSGKSDKNLLEQKVNAECNHFDRFLPIYGYRDEIITRLKEQHKAIVCGPSGIGKSTQLIQYVFESGLVKYGKIACVQPCKELVSCHGGYVAQQVRNTMPAKVDDAKNGAHEQMKMLYTTDLAMLYECHIDPHLRSYSCIIIDEFQANCPTTELLLAYLKSIKLLRNDLYLLIITNNSDVRLLAQFFAGYPVVDIHYKTFPVMSVARPLTKNVVKEAVDSAFNVITCKGPGDVLVILATPTDVLNGTKLMRIRCSKDKNIAVVPLLLFLRFKESRKEIHQNTAKGLRNVIFTTGNLEDVISLTNIRFVVDSGLETTVKQKTFHAHHETRYISDVAVADNRTNKASFMSDGECYQLYSTEKMSSTHQTESTDNSLPHMILQLLKINANPYFFQFLHFVSTDAIKSAFGELRLLGAVEEEKLTPAGEKMALLMLPLHLSSLLLKGIDQQLGYETLIFCVVAYVIGHMVDLTEVDELCSINLLQATELCMQWMKLNRSERSALEKSLKLNVSLMEIILDKIMELQSTLKGLGIKVKLSSGCEEWKTSIQKLIMQHWHKNLCFLHRVENQLYLWKLQNVKLNLKLPSPKAKGSDVSTPTTLIFERLWFNRSGKYLLSFVPIDNSILLSECEGLGISLDEDFRQNTIQEAKVIRHVGHYLMKMKIIGGDEEFRQQLVNHLSGIVKTSVDIQPCLKMGTVTIFSPPIHHNAIIKEIRGKLDAGKEVLLREMWEYWAFPDVGIRALMSKCGMVNQLLMPKEFVSLLFFLSPDEKISNVLGYCKKFGLVVHNSIKELKGQKKQLRVMFNSSAVAEKVLKAATGSKKYQIKPHILKCEDYDKSKPINSYVAIQWVRRKNKGTAVIQFSADSIYQSIGPLAKGLAASSYLSSAKFVADFDNCRLVLKNINPLLTRGEILENVNQCLADMEISLKETEVQVTQDPGFITTNEQKKVMDEELRKCLTVVYKSEIEVDVKLPLDSDEAWLAKVDTGSSRGNQDVYALLSSQLGNGHCFQGLPLRVTTAHCYSVYLSDRLGKYCSRAVVPNLIQTAALQHLNALPTEVKEGERKGITIESKSFQDGLTLYNCLLGLLEPIKFAVDKNVLGDELFTKNGKQMSFVDDLQEHEQLFLKYKPSIGQLVYLGPKDVRSKIDDFLQTEERKIAVHLEEEKIDVKERGLLRTLIVDYGIRLQKLKLEAGLCKLDLLVNERSIKIKGTSSAREKLKEELQMIIEELALRNDDDSSESDLKTDICPVCQDSVHNFEEHYRMEYCGHAYCMPCMEAFMAHSFPPIFCMHQDCSSGPLVLRDFLNFQHKNKHLLVHLERNAMEQCLRSNGCSVCPFPDCEGVVKRTKEAQICPTCFNMICASCGTLYHHNRTCEAFKAEKTPNNFDLIDL